MIIQIMVGLFRHYRIFQIKERYFRLWRDISDYGRIFHIMERYFRLRIDISDYGRIIQTL